MKRALKKLVFVEPKSTHLHVYTRVTPLGSVLGTLMRDKGATSALGHPRHRHERVSQGTLQGYLPPHLGGSPGICGWPTVREAGGIPRYQGPTSALPGAPAWELRRPAAKNSRQELVGAIQAGTGLGRPGTSYLANGRVINNRSGPRCNLDVNPHPDTPL